MRVGTDRRPYQLDSRHLRRNPADPSDPADHPEEWRVVHLNHRPHLQLAILSVLPCSLAVVRRPQRRGRPVDAVGVLRLVGGVQGRRAVGFGRRDGGGGQRFEGGFWWRQWRRSKWLFGGGHQGDLGRRRRR